MLKWDDNIFPRFSRRRFTKSFAKGMHNNFKFADITILIHACWTKEVIENCSFEIAFAATWNSFLLPNIDALFEIICEYVKLLLVAFVITINLQLFQFVLIKVFDLSALFKSIKELLKRKDLFLQLTFHIFSIITTF